jgi:hypothetical protein
VLSHEQRQLIKQARDAAVREGWSPRSISDVAEAELLGALSHEWETAAAVAEAVGLGSSRAAIGSTGRRLAGMTEVEVRRRRGARTAYRLRLVAATDDTALPDPAAETVPPAGTFAERSKADRGKSLDVSI